MIRKFFWKIIWKIVKKITSILRYIRQNKWGIIKRIILVLIRLNNYAKITVLISYPIGLVYGICYSIYGPEGIESGIKKLIDFIKKLWKIIKKIAKQEEFYTEITNNLSINDKQEEFYTEIINNLSINDKLLINISILVHSMLIILSCLLLVAYSILGERKLLGSIQRRRGPNVMGIFGLWQPIADAIKLVLKETIIPVFSNKLMFIIAPLLTLILSLLNWSIIPFSQYSILSDIQVSILMFFGISSLTVYGIIMSGWASNSKYAFLGALRAAAQVIAYEVSIGLTLIYILIQTNDLNYFNIIYSQLYIWNIIPCFIFFLLFFICCLAETNRPPFDLPEAEAELVSGYNVEYSAMTFGFFFLGEYVSIWLTCALNILIFFGGFFFIKNIENILIFSFKIILLVLVFIWVRGSLPRYRYDQLMRLGWKILLPISLGLIIFYIGIYYKIIFLDFKMYYLKDFNLFKFYKKN